MSKRSRLRSHGKARVAGQGQASKPDFPVSLESIGGSGGTELGATPAKLDRYNRQRVLAAATREPLDYRRQHRPVEGDPQCTIEQLKESIPDSRGGIGLPHRSYDTLAVLLRNGTLRAEEHDAGRTFEEDFALAGLDPLHASDPGRIPGHRQLEINDAIIAGRTKVRRAMDVLGGPTAPVGSAVWCILGFGQSLKEWASNCQFGQGGRSLDERVAKGIFLAGLAVLAIHFGTTGRAERHKVK